MGFPTASMTFHYIDSQGNIKTFPIHFLSTSELDKSADEHKLITRSALKNNDQIRSDILIISVTSDNKPSIAFGVDQYLNFSGPLRFICHKLGFAVYAFVFPGQFTYLGLEKINTITTYLNQNKINE